jgi:hypothetical protein
MPEAERPLSVYPLYQQRADANRLKIESDSHATGDMATFMHRDAEQCNGPEGNHRDEQLIVSRQQG